MTKKSLHTLLSQWSSVYRHFLVQHKSLQKGCGCRIHLHFQGRGLYCRISLAQSLYIIIVLYSRYDMHLNQIAFTKGKGVLGSQSNLCLSLQTVYKAWLCSQYFEVAQFHCSSRIPCKQYCLEVQTRCPFVLPDNDDLIYGGLPSFICTGLLNNHPTNAEPQCCDVRWESRNSVSNKKSKGTKEASNPMLCHRSSLASSAASRLCNTRLKLCVLVLILLHTVVTVSAAQNSTGLGFGGLAAWDENSTNDE
uniref:NALCN channel auxiliary factor 1 n=1 Tax=Callorhinchus milii TaxID=7868 RepID=A0A4W3H3S3_CALMI